MLTRREFSKLTAVAPLAAMSTPIPTPIYEQRLPLVSLPVAGPAGLGVGAPWQSDDDIPAMLERLNPAWWYDWRFECTGSPGYVPMIWSDAMFVQNFDAIESLIMRWPEQFWLLWNEPEQEKQANMTPERAAQLTGDIAGSYGLNYAAPGVSLTASGYRWLDAYMAAGGPVPPVWHVHIYWTQEPAQWSDAWAKWLDWMRANDCVRPTIVSETNAWTESAYGQRRMIEHVCMMLDTEPLLRAVAWFATRFTWGAGHPMLIDDAGNLTETGRMFAAMREQS